MHIFISSNLNSQYYHYTKNKIKINDSTLKDLIFLKGGMHNLNHKIQLTRKIND